MPLYEYQCEKCAHRFEVIQKFSDAPITTCPSCGGPVRKLQSAPAFQFKGTGWYVTDYAKSGAGEKSDSDGKGGRDEKETKKADSKNEKAESASDSGKSDAKESSKESKTPASSGSSSSPPSSKSTND